MRAVKVYGVESCNGTRRALRYLEALGVGYDFFDLNRDGHARAWVRWKTGGEAVTPTIAVAGELLRGPTESDLARVLGRAG